MSSFTSFALIALLALCVGYSAGTVASRARYNTERVYDFTVSEAKDLATWRAFGREWRVQLYLSDVTEDNTDYFHGVLDGDAEAVVSFSLLPGTGLSGMIAMHNQTWWIAARPLEEKASADLFEESELGVFMFREPLMEMNSKNEAAHPSEFAEPPAISDEDAADPDVDIEQAEIDAAHARRQMRQFKVAVFVDQRWTLPSNNPWSSHADTMGILNDVNAVFRAAGLATFSFQYVRQVTNTQSGVSPMLTHLSNTISAQNAHVFSDRSFTNYLWLVGQNVGGLAYVGTSCRANSQQKLRTGVAGLVSYSRLWTVKTIAHELAHNRGANHEFNGACTQSQTRGCQCSVMSYCFPAANNNPSGARNFFSQFNINEMRSAGCY